MNTIQTTLSDNVLNNNKLSLTNIGTNKFYPTNQNTNMYTKNGGDQNEQIESLNIRVAQKRPFFKPRTFSEDAYDQTYSNNCKAHYAHSDCCATESSAASSSGETEHDSHCHSQNCGSEHDYLSFSAQSSYQQYCEATRGAKKKNFNNAEERFQFKQQYESKKKTELCRNFEMYGQCKFGNTCSYAHGGHQLQKKTHLPSNFMTKLCTQFHSDGICMYGERCQFLHSVYDLKSELSYSQALHEGARLTDQRNKQISQGSGAECLWANLKTGNGCGAPKGPRLACFEKIYNKDNLQENVQTLQQEDDSEKAQEQQKMVEKKNQSLFSQPALFQKSKSYNVPQYYTPQKSVYQNRNSFVAPQQSLYIQPMQPMGTNTYYNQYQQMYSPYFRQI